jgi:hypothetical protein
VRSEKVEKAMRRRNIGAGGVCRATPIMQKMPLPTLDERASRMID